MLLTVFQPVRTHKVKRQRQNSEQAWTRWAWAAVVILGYPLSFGPVMLLIAHGILPGACFYLYLPLILLGLAFEPILALMYWSVHFCTRLLY